MSETTNTHALSHELAGLAGATLALGGLVAKLEDALAAAERELAGVRRVEDHMATDKVDGIAYDERDGVRVFIAYRVGPRYETDVPVAKADSLAALGRLLTGVADAPASASPQAQNTEGENG